MSLKAILLIVILSLCTPVIASKAKPSSVHSPTAAHSKNEPDGSFLRFPSRVQNANARPTTIEFNDKNFKHVKPVIADSKTKTVKINVKERSLKNWEMHRQLEALINKSKNDLRLEELIQKHLEDGFKRASIYDLYPLELYDTKLTKLDEANRAEFVDYYDYARRELISVSQGPQLKYLYQDYDQDGNGDYAVIVARRIEFDKKGLAHKPSHKDRIYLLIANTDQVNYFQPLNADYLELINGGRYPTNLAIGRRLVKVNGPAFRVLALDNESYVLYYDRNKSAWIKMYTDDRGDGG